MIAYHKLTRLRDILWLTLLAIYIFAGMRSVPFHGDESTTIWMSQDFYYAVVEGDIARLQYSEAPPNETEQHLRIVAAPLPKYIIGLAWTLDGYTPENINDQWLWGAGWDYNLQNGHIPTNNLLMTSRLASTIMLIGSMLIVYQIARIIGGTPVAYLASLYYTLNPAILINGRRAMLEGTSLFFLLLVILAGLWLLKHRTWGATLLLGVASGLAVASKHPNTFTVIIVFITIGAYSVYRSTRIELDSDDIAPPTIAPDDPLRYGDHVIRRGDAITCSLLRAQSRLVG